MAMASIVAVAKRLGHTDTQQTLNTYAHLFPCEDEFIIKILENTKQQNIFKKLYKISCFLS